MEKTNTLLLLLARLFPKTEIPYICEMLPLETKQSGGKLLPDSYLRVGVFLGEISSSSSRRYSKKDFKEKKKK